MTEPTHYLRRFLRALLTRPRTASAGWAQFGDPVQAIIGPAACGGFLLFIEYPGRRIRAASVDIGTRWDEYGNVPNPDEIHAADTALPGMGMTRTGPWQPDHRGFLTAPLTRTPTRKGSR